MVEAALFADHFALCERKLDEYLTEFARYGIQAHPALKVQYTNLLYPHYIPDSPILYINVLDPHDPLCQLKAQATMILLSFESIDEFVDFWQLQIPYLIAHELGHHLRDYYQQRGEKHWLEEQIANQFASAAIKARLSQSEKERYCHYLRRGFEGLAPKIEADNDALIAYGHIHYALHSLGMIDRDTLESVEHTATQQRRDAGDVLAEHDGLPAEIIRLLARRKAVIAGFNEQYIANPVRYTYYHLAWTYYELTSIERFNLADLARKYLAL
jgi:hypothetical protein